MKMNKTLVEISRFTNSETILNKIINVVAGKQEAAAVEVTHVWDPNMGATRRLIYLPYLQTFVMGVEPNLPEDEHLTSWESMGGTPTFAMKHYENHQWWIKSVLLAWEKEINTALSTDFHIPRSLFIQVKNALLSGEETVIDTWNTHGVNISTVKREFKYCPDKKTFLITGGESETDLLYGGEGILDPSGSIGTGFLDEVVSEIVLWFLETKG